MVIRLLFVTLAAVAACGYQARFGDCEVSCETTTGCPSGLSCESEGRCRVPDFQGTCAAILGEGSNELTSFAFPSAANPLATDVTATISGTLVTATVPFATDITALKATFSTTGADVTVRGTAQVSGVTSNDFTAPVTYRVIAADGTTQDYTVIVTVAQNPEKDITDFSFLAANNPGLSTDVVATISGTTITATVPYGTNITALKATFLTTGTSVTVQGVMQVSSVTANNFTSPVTYRVSAVDASTKDYAVTVAAASASTKDITAFSFLRTNNSGVTTDVVATISGTNITATVQYGASITALKATFSITGASVTVAGTTQVSGTTANNFTSPVIYRVTAADASTKDYTVTVTRQPATAKDITAFSFRKANNPALSTDRTASISGTNISISVPYGTPVTALKATFSTTGASVTVNGTAQVSGLTANDFTNPVVYRVTAGDASTKDYTVTVTIFSGGTCFGAGTQVTMADGLTKNIEDVRVGDLVLAYDVETGRAVPSAVVRLFVHPDISPTLLVNGTIRTTPNHPFLVSGRWVRADELQIGDVGHHVELQSITGETTVSPMPFTSLKSLQATGGVYNLEVATYHTYIVNGLVVHNKIGL